MKSNQNPLEDRLLEALLQQQGDHDAEQAIREIENALDAKPVPIPLPVSSPWRKRLGIIAASVTIGGLVALSVSEVQKSGKKPVMSKQSSMLESPEARRQELAALDKSIRDQEDKVEERTEDLGRDR